MTRAERQQHRELDVAVRLADGVERPSTSMDAGWQFTELRHQVLHGVGDGDGVGAGLPLDAERDGALLAFGRIEPGARV